MPFPSLPATLTPVLTGRDAVADAVYRCVNSFDADDDALFHSAFTQDATFELNGKPMDGLAAIKDQCFALISKLDTTHFITGLRINLESDSKASATCSALAQHYRGSQGLEAGATHLLAGSLYWLELVKDNADS